MRCLISGSLGLFSYLNPNKSKSEWWINPKILANCTHRNLADKLCPITLVLNTNMSAYIGVHLLDNYALFQENLMLLPFIIIEVCVFACGCVHQVSLQHSTCKQTFIGYLQCAKYCFLYYSLRLMAQRMFCGFYFYFIFIYLLIRLFSSLLK